MAMYGINCGLPKTVIKATVNYFKSIYPEVSDILDSVLDTPISPELSSNQLTEDIIGKYEINDFILYHFLVNGDSNERIVYLLKNVLNLDEEKALEYINNFNKRFYRQQFKRLTMPEGVKILNLSLSPRSETKLSGDIYKSSK
jgi:NAD+ synthase (glutamine-hydrolysing)